MTKKAKKLRKTEIRVRRVKGKTRLSIRFGESEVEQKEAEQILRLMGLINAE